MTSDHKQNQVVVKFAARRGTNFRRSLIEQSDKRFRSINSEAVDTTVRSTECNMTVQHVVRKHDHEQTEQMEQQKVRVKPARNT
jgi:hypothetical protein